MNEKEILVPEFVTKRGCNSKRKEFIERYRADKNTIDSTVKISTEQARKQEKIVNIGTGKEKHKISRDVKRRIRRSRKKAKLPKAVKKLLTAGLIGVMVFGGVKQYQEYKEQQNSRPSLEDVLDDNITLEKLGLDENIEDKIQEMKQKDIDNLPNSELIKLPEEINELQLDIIKSKFSNMLETGEENIKVKQSMPNRVEIYEDGKLDTVFTEQDKIDEILTKIGIKDEKQISTEIGKYIYEIANMQRIMEVITNGDIDREAIIKACKKSIENADKFSAREMIKDGNLIKMADATELAKSQEKEIDEEERS